MILIFQTLLTAALSGIFSGVILFGLNERRDRNETALQKLEKSYLLIETWSKSEAEYYNRCFDIASGALPLNQALADSPRLRANIDSSWAEMSMMIYMYHNELTKHITPLLDAMRPLPKMFETIMMKKLNNEPIKPEELKAISNQLIRLVETKFPISNAIINKGRTIACRPYVIDRLVTFVRLGSKRPSALEESCSAPVAAIATSSAAS